MENLNPGIVKTVELLRAEGFDTCDSGDGVTHDFACDRSGGYVSIILRDDQDLEESASKVYVLLQERGITKFGGMDGTIVQSMCCPYEEPSRILHARLGPVSIKGDAPAS